MRRLLLILASVLAAAPAAAQQGGILIYSGTTGYRHDSIPAGIEAVRRLAADRGLGAEASEDPAIFTPERLSRFRVIVLLSTTTDPKNPASEWLVGPRATALRQFVANGGGILAIHAAADSHYHSPWYGRLIGGHFEHHPPGTPGGRVSIANPSHPANRSLPATVERTDEWYYFDDYDPRSSLLMTLDPASIGERDANANPMAWTRHVDGGRVFYTAMGHTTESYSEPWFVDHLAGGLDWLLDAGPFSRPGSRL
ncbi:MAG TPA: ThuA domain-containing protein [Sphingomicrobium sp.]|nr:ThuA domain-containing protein [Sphingomicrobium sp.]